MALAPHAKDKEAQQQFKEGKFKGSPVEDSAKRAERTKKESGK